MNYFVFFARGTLLLVFVAAVIGKVHSRAAWLSFVSATSALVGARRWDRIWAAGAAAIEICTTVLLSLNATAYFGLIVALAVVSVFLTVVVSGVARGIRTTCNCFGSDGNIIGWPHVWRNLLLTAVAALGVAAATDDGVPSVFAGASYASPIVLSVIAAAVLVMWDDLTFLFLVPSND